MTTPAWAGDPASVSHLGGTLRTTAARLLGEAVPRHTDGPPPAHSPGAPRSGPLPAPAGPASGELVERLAARLDECGARLQLHAQELAELAVSARRLQERVARADLVLDGLRVCEPMGIVDVRDAERRIRARPGLQSQADRIAARLGRSRAALTRALADAGQELQELARQAGAGRHQDARAVD